MREFQGKSTAPMAPIHPYALGHSLAASMSLVARIARLFFAAMVLKTRYPSKSAVCLMVVPRTSYLCT